MEEKKRGAIKVAVLFLAGGLLLLFLEVSLGRNTAFAGIPALYVFAVHVAMFGGVLSIFYQQCTRIAAQMEQMQQEINEADNTLKQAQTEFNETVERRTFEISVINASLNREIAERMQAEAESKKLQRRMELILDSAGEGIFGLDSEGNVTFTNKAASLMLGWTPEELVGKSHHDLVHHTHADGSAYQEQECPIYMAYKDGKVHFKSDDVFWGKDGKSFPVEYVSTPIKDAGTVTGAVVVFRDPTLI
jgi:PAS domain S-box-containing protein